MSAGWVAGSVRARPWPGAAWALTRRGGWPPRRRWPARCGRWRLRRTARGDAWADARRGAACGGRSGCLWDLRVLAGWLPRDGVRLLRTLAGWFELANVDELLQTRPGRPAGEEFRLGALATAWPQLRQAGSLARAAGRAGRFAVAGPGRGHRIGGPAGYAGTVGGAGRGASAIRRGPGRRARRHCCWPESGSRAGQAAAARRSWTERARPARPGSGQSGHAGGAGTAGLPGRARWALAGISSPAGCGGRRRPGGRGWSATGSALLRTSGSGQRAGARRGRRDGGRCLAGLRRAGDRRPRRRAAGGLRCGGLTRPRRSG